MPLVQLKRFLLGTGAEPVNCQTDNITKVIAEIVFNTEYGLGVNEEMNMIEITIVKAGTNTCVKKFRWEGACALLYTTTYMAQTQMSILPIGSYNILTGFIGSPQSRTLIRCEEVFTLKEVAC